MHHHRVLVKMMTRSRLHIGMFMTVLVINRMAMAGKVGGCRHHDLCTARLKDIDPEADLGEVVACIGRHSINRRAELLPWNRAPTAMQRAAA